MKKETESTIIKQLCAYIKSYPSFYSTDIEALSAKKTSELRCLCSRSDVRIIIVKSTLAHHALNEVDSVDFVKFYESLEGNTAVTFSEAANAPTKAIKTFHSNNKELGRPDLEATYVQEGLYVGADQLETLISIKSREELIADIIVMLEGSIQDVFRQLDSAVGTIHGVLGTLTER